MQPEALLYSHGMSISTKLLCFCMSFWAYNLWSRNSKSFNGIIRASRHEEYESVC